MKLLKSTSLGKWFSSVSDGSWNAIRKSKKHRLRYLIEAFICIPLFAYCLFLYDRWNRIPEHSDNIEVSCLSYNPPDSVRYWNPVATINYSINTSKVLHSELKDGDIFVIFSHWKPMERFDSVDESFNKVRYMRDSVALASDYWKLVRLKRRILRATLNNKSIEKEKQAFSRIMLSHPDEIDLYEAGVGRDPKRMIHYRDSMIAKCQDLTAKNGKFSTQVKNYRDSLHVLYYFQVNCKWNISEHKDYVSEPKYRYPDEGDDFSEKIVSWGYQDNTYFHNYFLLKTEDKIAHFADTVYEDNTPLMHPKWYSLFDISQSYFDVKLRSVAIDSVVLTFDFIGATDFSEMIPKPDVVTMSSVTFSNPLKIARIKKDGLKFHAHFKEYEGPQTIRLFAVTAIMCALTPILLIYLINIVVLILACCKHLRKVWNKSKKAKRTPVIEQGEQSTNKVMPEQ